MYSSGTSSLSSKCHFTKRTAAIAKQGMRQLLEIHDEQEIETLCESLRVEPTGPTKENMIDSIFESKLHTFEEYRLVLAEIWEGIIVEYLRRVGKRVSNFREDPRVTVLRYWLEDERFQVKGFGRIYVPR